MRSIFAPFVSALLVTVLAFAASTASTVMALETPLTLTQPANQNNNRLVTIDGTSGAMRLYELQQGVGAGAIEQKSVWNFQMDLDRIRNLRMPIPNPDKQAEEKEAYWSWMRIGAPNTIPAYGEMYNYFLPAARRTVLETENKFFEETPAYDGVVRAALSRSYLMVVVPSTYTMLVYKILNDDFELVSFRNYRPELYLTIPDQPVKPYIGSLPKFNDLKKQVRDLSGGNTLLAKRFKDMADAFEEMESEDKLIPVAKSDPWLSSLQNDRFVMIDPPNSKIMLWELPRGDALDLKSLRNFDLDRRIPSFPLPRARLNEFDEVVTESYMGKLKKSRHDGQILAMTKAVLIKVKELQAAGELTEVKPREKQVQVGIFRAFAEQTNAILSGDGASSAGSSQPYDVVVDPNERLLVDLKQERRLLIYLLRGSGDALELRSARDYTIDTGIAIYDYEVRKQRIAEQLMDTILKNARSRRGQDIAMLNIQYLLSMTPEYYPALEKNSKLRKLREHELWQSTIELAIKNAEKKQAAFDGIIDQVVGQFSAENAAKIAAKEGR